MGSSMPASAVVAGVVGTDEEARLAPRRPYVQEAARALVTDGYEFDDATVTAVAMALEPRLRAQFRRELVAALAARDQERAAAVDGPVYTALVQASVSDSGGATVSFRASDGRTALRVALGLVRQRGGRRAVVYTAVVADEAPVYIGQVSVSDRV